MGDETSASVQKGVMQWTGIKSRTTDQRDGHYQGSLWESEENEVSLKGFVNRLSHECHIDIDHCHIDIDRDVSTEYGRSSSVFKLMNNRRKSGRTKNIDIDNCFAYFTSRST